MKYTIDPLGSAVTNFQYPSIEHKKNPITAFPIFLAVLRPIIMYSFITTDFVISKQ